MTATLKDTYLKLIADATAAADAYHNSDNSPLTDDEYDVLLLRIENMGDANGWTEHDKLSNEVGDGVTGGGDITHRARMLSLKKVYNDEEVNSFLTSINNAATVVEPKLDGLAVTLNYKNGKLVQAATRGDSYTGKDITKQLLHATVDGAPRTISILDDVDVRGELFITDTDFIIAQEARERSGKPLFKNSRNAASGSIQSKTLDRLDDIKFTFVAYDIVHATGTPLPSYTEEAQALAAEGFITSASLIKQTGTVQERVAAFNNARDTFKYPTDGAVIKADDYSVREKLGEGSKNPRWAVAYKYETAVKTTELISITRDVGRTGAVSYVGNFKPVEFADSTVEQATLNNANFIHAMRLGIGSAILVRKAGEIIPEILGVDYSVPQDNIELWKAPTTCPKCDSDLDTSSVVWRCGNPDCAQANRIIHAVSRDNLDVRGLSTAVIERLIETNRISDVTDLFSVTEQEFTKLVMRVNEKGTEVPLGNATAKKLVAALEQAKQQPLNRVLSSLGFRFLGRTFGRRFAQHFKSFDAFMNATVEDMQKVDGVAEKATSIHQEVFKNHALLKKYRQVGFTQLEAAADAGAGGVLDGKSVVITGSLPGYSRTEAQELIEKHGGNSGSSVSGRTTFLVAPADERTSSKAVKAAKLGLPIITPEEFLNMLK